MGPHPRAGRGPDAEIGADNIRAILGLLRRLGLRGGQGRGLYSNHRAFAKPRDGLTKEGTMIYFARKHDCEACAFKPKCCPNVPARKIARSIHEAARDKARAIAKTEAYAV